ncbi:MAG TPA: hypothetical protein PKD72_04400, partial [Gemmatales bacterium]|nr:hypothetical protein [Gemmatales bacterium]
LRKIWNNVTTRSNTFTIWMTIGFFEFDDVNGLGAELGQIQGKNTRYRFFAVVDRTTIDSWLQSWNLHNPPNSSQPASINLFVDTGLFPTLDPRQDTYPNINRNNPGITTVISTNYARVPVSPMLPGEVEVTPASTNPFTASDIGRLVQVESEAGTERGEILGFVGPNIRIRLVLQHTGVMAIRALPVPTTVLYWSQLK